MKTVNSISGGKTSAYIAANYPADYDVFALVRSDSTDIKFKDRKLAQMVEDRLQMPFIATLEDDIIINTIFDLEQFIGREITWVSSDTFDNTITRKKALPNFGSAWCTYELKIWPIMCWWQETFNLEIIDTRIGYRANEVSRAKKHIENTDINGVEWSKFIVGKRGNRNKWKLLPWRKFSFPTIEDGVYKDNINSYWGDKNVRFAPINNCVGCWWQPPLLLRKRWDWHPNKMNWFSSKEGPHRWKGEGTYLDFKGNGLQIDLFPEDFGGNDGCESGYCGI